MRIGVISDTHGDLNIAKIAIKNMSKIDALFHAGDHYKDAVALKNVLGDLPVYAVVGNCDFEIFKPKDLFIEIAEKKIWLTHGHKYNVKNSDELLVKLAKEKSVDIVIYGHTHIAISRFADEILIFNPGSTTRPRGGKPASYGMIEIDDDGETYADILTLS